MIELCSVSKRYGDKPVLRDLSLTLTAPGSYAVLGPSGCGKTTLLRLIAGLEKPTSGLIRIANDTRMAVCFQENRLLPWKTVQENVALAVPSGDRMQTARRWLERVGLGDECHASPAALSGGMKRRAALARALAADAPILLLDEPFRALDEATHREMLALVRTHAQGRLLLLVTHDQADAEGMQVIRLEPITHETRSSHAD